MTLTKITTVRLSRWTAGHAFWWWFTSSYRTYLMTSLAAWCQTHRHLHLAGRCVGDLLPRWTEPPGPPQGCFAGRSERAWPAPTARPWGWGGACCERLGCPGLEWGNRGSPVGRPAQGHKGGQVQIKLDSKFNADMEDGEREHRPAGRAAAPARWGCRRSPPGIGPGVAFPPTPCWCRWGWVRASCCWSYCWPADVLDAQMEETQTKAQFI